MSVPSTRDPKKILISQIVHQWVEVFSSLTRREGSRLKLSGKSPSQKRSVNEHPTVRVEAATVFDEATHSKLIHEEIDARPCSADHPRQGTLRYPAKSVQLAFPVAREQKKSPGEPPLAALRNLVD
jgi:hypothetical protein